MKKIGLFIPALFLTLANVLSQNYHAIHGSSYAGSLGVGNNPASIVNTPYPWDINLISGQLKTSTNAFTVLNYSFLSSPLESQYRINSGNYSRYNNTNFNIHLFNTRFAINPQQGVAFGMNIRGYGQIKTGPYNFRDSMGSLNSFLKMNEGNPVLTGELKSSSWVELFGTYSRTLWERETHRLNAGITLKVTRGIAGAFARVQNAGFEKSLHNSQPVYFLKNSNAYYGYSSTLDKWKIENSNSQNLKNIAVASEGSLSIDIGVEYLLKSLAVSHFYSEADYYGYEWKIGIAVLDIGQNQFKYGVGSRSIQNPKANIADSSLQNKLASFKTISAFNDTISTIVLNSRPFTGRFAIINPTRLVVNVDRYFFGGFYVNGEVSVSLSSLHGRERLHVTELNLLTLTPRWETRHLGAYMPIQYNSKRQFWIGGAFKAGPLLVGFHNWGNILAKNKTHNGGGYLALVLRPANRTSAFRDKRNECP